MRKLSIHEEALLFQGKDRWHTNHFDDAGHSRITMSDGPNGLRIEMDNTLGFARSYPAIAYPTASLIGCSFDRSLLKEYGNMLAEECMQECVDIILGPGANHKRSPIGGRNFEYISEDPVLSGELAAAYINGVQEKGIGTSLKHFATNSREYGRMVYDSIIDQRTLHEIYLKQFMITVKKSHPWTIMNAYNKLNGMHCTENKKLMDEARSWGFDGAFISDWGAVYDPVEALKAGLNLEMPGGDIGADQLIEKAIDNGSLKEDVLHENTRCLLNLSQRCGHYSKNKLNKKEHHDFICKCAEESIVLLKNENAILPLHDHENILVIGPFAKYPRFTGEGSSSVNSQINDNILTSLKKYSSKIYYADGFSKDVSATDESLLQKAKQFAKSMDKVVIVCALPNGNESEGFDRKDLSLPKNQLECIEQICSVNRHVIVVLQTGSPVLLSFKDQIEGLLLTYLSGSQGGLATSNILFGKKIPCGKLAETWPVNECDIPSCEWFENDRYQTQYRETIYTGYRYYDSFQIPTNYDFGFGLSYTTFEYISSETIIQDDHLLTSITLQNTGRYDAKEIIEIYFSLPKSKIARAKHELINFEKVFLRAGEKKTIAIQTDIDVLKYYDAKENEWKLEDGDYEIMAGASLNHLPLKNTIHLEGYKEPVSFIKKEMYFFQDGSFTIKDEDYQQILQHALPQKHEAVPFTADSTLKDLKEKKLGKVIYKIAESIANSGLIAGVDQSLIDEAVIRQLIWVDGMSWKTVELGVSYMNQHRFSTLKQLIKSIKKKK